MSRYDEDDAVVLPRRAFPQPMPSISGNGDCSACAISGMLGLKGGPVELYAMYPEEACVKKPGDTPKSFSWYEARQVICNAAQDGLLSDYLDAAPLWIPNYGNGYYGAPGFMMALEWYRYLRMALQAGYYALANVVHGKTAPIDPPDHAVLLVGARTRWAEGVLPGSKSGHFEVLVSCSSTRTPDEEWVDVHKFLRDRGGYNIYLAKPSLEAL